MWRPLAITQCTNPPDHCAMDKPSVKAACRPDLWASWTPVELGILDSRSVLHEFTLVVADKRSFYILKSFTFLQKGSTHKFNCRQIRGLLKKILLFKKTANLMYILKFFKHNQHNHLQSYRECQNIYIHVLNICTLLSWQSNKVKLF